MRQLGNKYYAGKNTGNSGLSLEYFKWALFSDIDPFLFHVQHEKLRETEHRQPSSFTFFKKLIWLNQNELGSQTNERSRLVKMAKGTSPSDFSISVTCLWKCK